MTAANNGVTTQTPTQPAATVLQQGPGVVESMTPIVLMLVACYFFLIRPAQKREKKRKEQVNQAKRGDKVVTASGIVGRIHKTISEREISLEVAEGVRIRMLRSAILEILDKSSTLGADDPDEAEASRAKNKKKEIA